MLIARQGGSALPVNARLARRALVKAVSMLWSPFSSPNQVLTHAAGAFIMQVVDIGLSEIDAFSVQYARAFKPCGFRLMFVHSSNWRLAV